MKLHELAEKGVVEPFDEGGMSKSLQEEGHYHTWSCGCQTRLRKDYWEIIYCKEDCELYLIFKEGEPTDGPERKD